MQEPRLDDTMRASRLEEFKSIATDKKTEWFNLAYLVRTEAKRIGMGTKKRKLFKGFRSGNGGKEDESDPSMRFGLQRELHEELGQRIAHEKIRLVGIIWGFNKNTTSEERTPIVCPVYFAETDTEDFKLSPKMQKETGDFRFFDFDQLPLNEMPVHVREFLPRLLKGERLSIFVDMELDYNPTEDLIPPVYLSPTDIEPLPPILNEDGIKRGVLDYFYSFPPRPGQFEDEFLRQFRTRHSSLARDITPR
jgi:8-oxo-dGTP pyrophosphatase MutT (NUDIX family)